MSDFGGRGKRPAESGDSTVEPSTPQRERKSRSVSFSAAAATSVDTTENTGNTTIASDVDEGPEVQELLRQLAQARRRKALLPPDDDEAATSAQSSEPKRRKTSMDSSEALNTWRTLVKVFDPNTETFAEWYDMISRPLRGLDAALRVSSLRSKLPENHPDTSGFTDLDALCDMLKIHYSRTPETVRAEIEGYRDFDPTRDNAIAFVQSFQAKLREFKSVNGNEGYSEDVAAGILATCLGARPSYFADAARAHMREMWARAQSMTTESLLKETQETTRMVMRYRMRHEKRVQGYLSAHQQEPRRDSTYSGSKPRVQSLLTQTEPKSQAQGPKPKSWQPNPTSSHRTGKPDKRRRRRAVHSKAKPGKTPPNAKP